MRSLGAFAFLLSVSLPSWAALPNLNYQEPGSFDPPQMGALLLRVVISLVVVLGLAVLVTKFLQRRTFISRPGHWIRVLDQVMVGPNKGLLLAEIAGKIYVLGITDHNITKLLEIEDPEQVAAILSEEGHLPGPYNEEKKLWHHLWEGTFRQILKKEGELLGKQIFNSKKGN